MQENSKKNKGLGGRGEDLAAKSLEEQGFAVIARNVRYKTGEIDIVARRGKELHFIEVKCRTDPAFVPPLEAVTPDKQRRVRRAAELFLSDHRNGFKGNNLPQCYLSVIGVDLSGEQPKIECIFDAFS